MKTFKLLLSISLLTLSFTTSAQTVFDLGPDGLPTAKYLREQAQKELEMKMNNRTITAKERLAQGKSISKSQQEALDWTEARNNKRKSDSIKKIEDELAINLEKAKLKLDHKISTLNRLVEEYGTIYVSSDSYNYNWTKEDEEYLTPENKEKMASYDAKLAEEKVIREYEERKIDYGFGVKVLVLDKALIIELPERKYYEAEFKTQYTDNSKIYNKKTKKFIEHQTVKNDTIKVYSFLEDKPGTLILLWDLQEKLIRKIANGEVYDVNFKSMRGNVSGGSNRGAEEIRKQLDIELEKDSDISSIVNRKWYSIKTDNKLEINRDILGEYKIIYSSPEGSISGIYLLDGNKLVHKKDRSGYFEFNYNEDDTLDFTNWAYINGKLEKKEIWKFSK